MSSHAQTRRRCRSQSCGSRAVSIAVLRCLLRLRVMGSGADAECAFVVTRRCYLRLCSAEHGSAGGAAPKCICVLRHGRPAWDTVAGAASRRPPARLQTARLTQGRLRRLAALVVARSGLAAHSGAPGQFGHATAAVTTLRQGQRPRSADQDHRGHGADRPGGRPGQHAVVLRRGRRSGDGGRAEWLRQKGSAGRRRGDGLSRDAARGSDAHSWSGAAPVPRVPWSGAPRARRRRTGPAPRASLSSWDACCHL